MKHPTYLFALTLLLFPISKSQALDQNKKMGKPTHEEMSMTRYAPDPSAKAVVLWSNTDINFSIGPAYDRLIYSHKYRIKILQDDGVEAGTVSIPYYDIDESNKIEEEITDLRVTTYNLVDGQVVASVLPDQAIRRQQVAKDRQLLTFTAPDVKAGSVIEYEYQLHSAYYLSPRTWYAQGLYPVFLAEYSFNMPEWFLFSTHLGGTQMIVPSYSHGDFKCQHPHDGLLQAATNRTTYTVTELPALAPSPLPLAARQECTRLEYDLREVRIPLQVFPYFNSYWYALYKREGQSVFFDDEVGYQHFRYRLKDYLYPNEKTHGIGINMTFNYSWESLAQTLYKHPDFGECLTMKNPLAQEQQSLQLTDAMSVFERVTKLRQLLLANYQWDGNYSLFVRKNAIARKNSSLNMGSMNFIMLSMLRDAGIKVSPVVMSRSSKGQLPSYVSSRYLNAMVLRISLDNGSIFYVDPTSDALPITALPPELLFHEGIAISQQGFFMVNTSTIDAIPLKKIDSEF